MKTTLSSKLARIFCITALIVTAVSQIRSAHAVSIGYLLTLTENSSTSLSLAYTGPGGTSAFSVPMNTSPDHWTISVLSQTISFMDFTLDWTEPENPGEVNEVYSGITAVNTLFVESDQSILTDGNGMVPIFPNNTITPTAVGSDGGVPIFLQFNDLAQGAEAGSVPDRASTFALLSLSLAGLLGLRRLRICQPA